MKTTLKNLLLATAIISPMSFAAQCSLSDLPELPNGKEATMDEMIAGQQAVKAFQADAQAFRACIDGELEGLKAAAEDGDKAAAESFKMKTDAYNASVAAEEQLAVDFNKQIKAFKAK